MFRRVLMAVAPWCLFLLLEGLTASKLHAENAIQTENAKHGTTAWKITNYAQNHEIEGYASLTSVNQGGEISFFVNTTDPTFTIDIFRMGWYAGLGGRRMFPSITLPGVQQPIPTPDAKTGLTECDWSVSYTLRIPGGEGSASDWTSGVYLALLTGSRSRKQSYIIFVVRDDAGTADYFFQCAVDTYQAYNNWGGKSLYGFNSQDGNPARKVSFNRPYTVQDNGGAGQFLDGSPEAGWEYNAVRFLEREGYDVTYGTDIDVHENPNLLLSHKADLIFGHSEYWSWEMRTNVLAARDHGVSLGIFAANVCYWQIRLEPSTVDAAPDRTMVGYKTYAGTEDPYFAACEAGQTSQCHRVTTMWRHSPVGLPEDAFIGVMYAANPVDGDIVVTDSSNWVFDTSGLADGDHLPGLLGYEVDRMFGHAPEGTVRLAHSPYSLTSDPTHTIIGASDMTVYQAASGATVFATGSIQWSWGLDGYGFTKSRVNFAAQQITRNLLARFIGDQPPRADPGGPYNGLITQPVHFDGTGSTDPDGSVESYEWDFGDGKLGSGPSPTHAYDTTGTYTVTLIVTDNQGSRNAARTTAVIVNQPRLSLSSASLSFSGQPVTTKSPALAVSLSNTGTAPLEISSITTSGDYSQTNDCRGSIPAGGSCAVYVTFSPRAAGLRTGALTISDNAPGSPHAVTLAGIGQDYWLTANASFRTITAGDSTTYILNVTPEGGFRGPVSLACSGAPVLAACSIVPESVSLTGTKVVTAWVTVTTTAKESSALDTWTPAGAYVLRITGASGGLRHSVSVTLDVKPDLVDNGPKK